MIWLLSLALMAKDDKAVADALCKRDGYTKGYFDKGVWCSDFKGSIDDFINRRVYLGQPDFPPPVAKFKKDSEPTGRLWMDGLKLNYDEQE